MSQIKDFMSNVNCATAMGIMTKYYNNPKFHVIDTRCKAMYENGHLKGAILLDAFDHDFKNKLNKLDKDHTYLVYCTAGIRSMQAINEMKEMGFRYIYHLEKGLDACVLQKSRIEL